MKFDNLLATYATKNDQEDCGINRVKSIIENEDKTLPVGGHPEHWIDHWIDAWHELEGAR